MRRISMIVLILLASAATSEAELNTYYRGVDRMTSKEVPAAAQFSIEPGRIALVMKGSRDCRMIFLEKEEVLRIVDDGEKTYFDMEKGWLQSAGEASSRCFEKDEMTLDLRAESFDRKALSKDLFEIPPDYKEFSIPVPEE